MSRFLIILPFLVIGCVPVQDTPGKDIYPRKNKWFYVHELHDESPKYIGINFGDLLQVSLIDDKPGYSWHLRYPATSCCLRDVEDSFDINSQGDKIRYTKFYFGCYHTCNLIFDYHNGDEVERSFVVEVTRKGK